MMKLLLALMCFVTFTVAADAEIYIYPGTRFCTDPIPHSAVFKKTLYLTAGTVNHFSTTGTSGWLLQGGRPDPVMWIVDSTGKIVAYNDDYVSFDSDIVFIPTTTGMFTLIVHSYTTSDAGFTNVLFSVGGSSPTKFATAKFGGTHVMTDWRPGIKFGTKGGNGDTVLFLFTGRNIGSQLLINDDYSVGAGSFLMGRLNSSITTPIPNSHGGEADNYATKAIVGSYSQYTEGETTLCQDYRSWMSPLLSPPQGAPKPAPVPKTPEMAQYLTEYSKMKAKLLEMDADERDRAILELQRRILPESQIRTFTAPVSFPTAAYVRAQTEYLAQANAKEKELTKLDHEQRAAALETMKAETVGRALLKVEPDYGLELDMQLHATP